MFPLQAPLSGLMALLLPLLLAGCLDRASEGAAKASEEYSHRAVGETLVELPGYEAQRRFMGSVQVKEQAQLGFELAGKVASLFVDEGDRVAAGDPLAQLDTRLLETDQQRLEAQQQELVAELQLVDSNLSRIRSLSSSGFASQQSLDELESRRQALQAKQSSTRAGLEANRLRREKSLLRAPFDGVVDQRLIAPGEVVGAGTPALSLLLRGGAEVKVGVPVRLLAQLRPRMPVEIAGQTFEASLIARGYNVDPVTRTVQLRLQLPPEAAVVNGELAQLLIDEHVEASGFWVPLTALTDGVRGLWNVFVLQPEADSGLYRLEARDVRILYANQERAFVSGSLADGEQLLSAGLHRLVPGQRVRLTPVTAALEP
ncbi:efflux RND transporter periplasmic adaptor subunit [Aestuariirhabdus litorea]|uniref:Efflux RND transporter periplasmic adaptor subunit n=1 Tax=Aestuariirhabdus litorea TaxID=2528527 RepID=A0A3P3VLY2_9GAMM|nr:efflux RND transporter periplasmic adaptor subunit [Aestuariirhabdus litorea]RRJ83781.1 efflux RND transporter periplasmic adaptor subunit [Aestuariirhabdus litorea]RWW97004.1 efflux RND transporter periplasmic adaptor subunit [Endozoicomonadaceae bacterium GTF-13]